MVIIADLFGPKIHKDKSKMVLQVHRACLFKSTGLARYSKVRWSSSQTYAAIRVTASGEHGAICLDLHLYSHLHGSVV